MVDLRDLDEADRAVIGVLRHDAEQAAGFGLAPGDPAMQGGIVKPVGHGQQQRLERGIAPQREQQRQIVVAQRAQG